MQIIEAVRTHRKLKLLLDGISNSGKTFTFLRLAHYMQSIGMIKKIAVIDTERKSSSLYAGKIVDGIKWKYQKIELDDHSLQSYCQALELAKSNGYDCIIIDSLSHAWVGQNGILQKLNESKSKSTFNAWSDLTPLQNLFLRRLMDDEIHTFCTLRTKTSYKQETNEQGKTVIKRVGTVPIQRKGTEYEFDLWGRIEADHTMTIEKSRYDILENAVCNKPGPEFWKPLLTWWQAQSDDEIAKPAVIAETLSSPEFTAAQQAINEAKTLDELAAVGKFIKDHVTDAGEREQLKTIYTAKQTSLKGI